MMNRLRPTANTGPMQTDSFTGRKKVTLAPGHSLMDWIRLGRASDDLSGVGPIKMDVTASELSVHNTEKDLWMAIRNKVYNLTPYVEYHPGGAEELMRAAGKDGTEMFDEVHNWVNVESMLEKCLVGNLIADSNSKKASSIYSKSVSSVYSKPPGETSVGMKFPFTLPSLPHHDWYQTKNEVIVVIYTKWEDMRHELVIVDTLKDELTIEAFIRDSTYVIHMRPARPLISDCKVTVSAGGKVEVILRKADEGVPWDVLGVPLKWNDTFKRSKSINCKYRNWTVTSNTMVTHDTRLMGFLSPPECRMVVPPGYHVHIKTDISGMEIARSYTVVVPSLTKPFSDPNVMTGKTVYLMVKAYKGGALSPWITLLKPGDKVMMSNYDGNFDIKRLERASHLVMFAAGTGFTSMVTLIVHALFVMNKDSFPIKLVFYNKSQKDILWQDQLAELTKTFSRFSVIHCLSQETDTSWKGLRGRVSLDHVKKFVPTPKETPNPLFCISGQWAYNDSVESFGKSIGLQDEHIHVFTQVN